MSWVNIHGEVDGWLGCPEAADRTHGSVATTEKVEAMEPATTRYYEVWEDSAGLRDLVRALIITVGLTMAGYLLAPGDAPAPLIGGLIGAVVGFVISAVITPTKRTLETSEPDPTEDSLAPTGGEQ